MGGDGILSEVIQGLLSRSDAASSLVSSFPVGVSAQDLWWHNAQMQ